MKKRSGVFAWVKSLLSQLLGCGGVLFGPYITRADLPADHGPRMEQGILLFRSEIAHVLREHCLECHGGDKVRGDLDLATRAGLLRGGSHGPAIIPFNASESLLMRLIRHQQEPHMPERKPRLPDPVIASLAQWIDAGAPYEAPLIEGREPPKDRSMITDKDREWWAFQPLRTDQVPTNEPHPIDAFLRAKATPNGLDFAAPAPPRVLIRRATLDLTGVPPGVEEVTSFIANPDTAYDALIDRLLASPAYGERWARHWLDVARFAESSGFEHDYDRPHAYHYRDFVIRALNDDMPFDQFARWQLAGDEFDPKNPLAMMATGFLGAGVFPTQITANEVERTRYDAKDDMLATTGSAFLGLTIGCARCHDHKSDPIPAVDYYRMLSTFTTTVRSNIDLEIDPAANEEARIKHATRLGELHTQLDSLETGALREQFTAWLESSPTLPSEAWSLPAITSIKSQGGATFTAQDDGSWLAGGHNANDDVYTITARSPLRNITGLRIEALTHPSAPRNGPGRASNGNFALSRITVSAKPLTGEATSRNIPIRAAMASHQQNTGTLSVASSLDDNPKSGWAVDLGGIGKDQAAAFTFAEPLDNDDGSELTITLDFFVNTGHNLVRPRISLTTQSPPDLQGEPVPSEIAALAPRFSALAPDERNTVFAWWKKRQPAWQKIINEIAAQENAQKPVTSKVMVCAEGHPPIVMHSQGAPFLKETHVLRRGDPNQKVEVATQGFLQVLSGGTDISRWQWSPPPGAPYSGRRRTFANWLTDTEHGAGALMARVTVNRLWQHHFGRGIVSTPNDFGHTGMAPSHPELLDWLAAELIRHEWHLKPIHKLIMTSRAYRQSSHANAASLASDPDNTFFMRFTPRRLEGEAVRDSILAVSGLLDQTMYGPGSLNENSTRRSIYFTVKRSRLMNSMLVFDAPEPLISQGSRPTTTVAPQALLLMNSSQARSWASAFASNLLNIAPDATPDEWVNAAYLRALARPPSDTERQQAVAFIESGIEQYQAARQKTPARLALTDFCQILVSLNEFAYVN